MQGHKLRNLVTFSRSRAALARVVHANVITRVDPTSSINSGGANETGEERERASFFAKKAPLGNNNAIDFTSRYGTQLDCFRRSL